jgi:hypothetical protein
VTVVIGVVTVAVVPRRAVTVVAVIGVMTLTVAAIVAGVGIRTFGKRTVGTRSPEGQSDRTTGSVVDERVDASVTSSLRPCVGAAAPLAIEPSADPK